MNQEARELFEQASRWLAHGAAGTAPPWQAAKMATHLTVVGLHREFGHDDATDPLTPVVSLDDARRRLRPG